MKIRSLAIAVAVAAVASATFSVAAAHADGTRAAARADNALACSAADPERRLEILLEPHDRYIATTRIDVADRGDDLMRAFQEPGEAGLNVTEASLHMELDPKTCTLDRTSRSHLLECPNVTDVTVGRFHLSSMRFTYSGPSSLGATQTIVVERALDVVSVTVHAEVQPKQGLTQMEDRVVASITVNARVGGPNGQVRTLHVTKDLGEWTPRADRSDWDRCLITAR